MKIETQLREDHQLSLTAEVEPETFQKTMRQAARKISQQTRIPGFRPGKAPYDIVVRMVGEDAIQKEAVNILIDEVYPLALKEADVQPYAPGQLEDIPSMDPVTFKFLVPLQPKVDLGDYRSVRSEYTPAPLDEKDVDTFLERLRGSYASINPADRPAQVGDIVSVVINATRTDPAEGENPELIAERYQQAHIRPEEKDAPDEWPFPGFGRQLIGASAEEERVFMHTFADDSPYESLRGKTAEFKVKVQSVKSMELPELNDEFAQSVGEFETADALLKSIRENLEHQSNDEYDRTYFAQLVDKVIEGATIKYPPQALQDEIDNVLRSVENDLSRQGLDLDTYLKIRKLNREEFIENEAQPAALKRLQRSLIMDELARAEKIAFDEGKFEEEFSRTMSEMQRAEDFEQMRKKMPAEQLANAIAMEAASRVMNRQVQDRLKAIATGQGDVQAEEMVQESTVESQPEAEAQTEEETSNTEATAE